jgi:hypothetical protein
MESIGQEIRYEGIHCEMRIWRPGESVVVVNISGHDVGEFGDAPLRELARDLAGNETIELFVDARHTQSASVDVSNQWAQWLGDNRLHFRRINMLTGSRFIQVSAEFVRRFAGLSDLMRIYTDGTAFDEDLARAIEG